MRNKVKNGLKPYEEVLKPPSKSLLMYSAHFKANELRYLISGWNFVWKQWPVIAKT